MQREACMAAAVCGKDHRIPPQNGFTCMFLRSKVQLLRPPTTIRSLRKNERGTEKEKRSEYWAGAKRARNVVRYATGDYIFRTERRNSPPAWGKDKSESRREILYPRWVLHRWGHGKIYQDIPRLFWSGPWGSKRRCVEKQNQASASPRADASPWESRGGKRPRKRGREAARVSQIAHKRNEAANHCFVCRKKGNHGELG